MVYFGLDELSFVISLLYCLYPSPNSFMRAIAWNCQGICNVSTVTALRVLIRTHCREVIFLFETKASDSRMNSILNVVGFSNYVAIGPKGRNCGVCLIWSSTINVEVIEYNSQTIGIKIIERHCSWVLIGFYGLPSYKIKMKSWVDLRAFLLTNRESWMCMGDINVMLED